MITPPQVVQFVLLSLAFLTTLGLLIARGAFTDTVLRRGPKREVGLDARDLIGAMGAYLAGGLLLVLLVSAWPGAGEPDSAQRMDKTEVAWLGMALQLAMWGPATAYLVVRLWRGGHLRLGGLVPRHPVRDLGIAGVGVFVAFILSWGLGLVIMLLIQLAGAEPPEHGHAILKTLQETESWVVVALLAVSAIVIAPIAEEFFFRGLLQTTMQSVIGYEQRWLSILPVALFFGLIHVGSVPWVMIPVLVLLGVVFGWVYERTGSLWCAVLVHAGFNATSIVLNFVQTPG